MAYKNEKRLHQRADYIKSRVAKVNNKTAEIKRLSEELFLSERTIRLDLSK